MSWRSLRGPRRACQPRREGLPLAHRLAILYLALPLAVWLLGWMKWWIGVPAAVALGWALLDPLRGAWRPTVSRTDLIAALAALGWVLAVPAGGLVGGDEGDWPAHRSVFLDLGRGGWPTYLTDHLRDEPPLLRYYLGYHLVPGLMGKWFGPWALNWAVPLWTWGGLAILAALFLRGLAPARAALAAIVLVLFSGMDTLVLLLRDGLFATGTGRGPLVLASEGFVPTPAAPMALEYQSHAKTLGETPQHFITCGLATLLFVQLRSRTRFLAASGVVVVACFFWSALVAIGLLALALGLLWRAGARPFFGWRNAVVAPALAGILGLYLASGKVGFPSGWLAALYDSGFRLAADLAIVWLCEFALLAFLLWRLRPDLRRDPLFGIAVAVLVAAPWWWWGSVSMNDFCLRATLPALFLLCYEAARALAQGRRDGPAWARAGLAGVLGMGALTGLAGHLAFLAQPRAPGYEQAGRSLLVDQSFDEIAERTAPAGALEFALRAHRQHGGSRGALLARSALQPLDAVYFWQGRLLHVVRRECTGDARFLLRFSVHAEGEASQPAPAARGFGAPNTYERKGYGDCVFKHAVPAPAARSDHRVVVGRADGEHVRWLAEIAFEGGAPAAATILYDDTARAAETEYAALAERPPTARGEWALHLAAGALAYVKRPCGPQARRGRFFLHATPLQASDLPSGRRAHGFVNLDFSFRDKGVVFRDICLVERRLPRYALRRVTTGQLGPDGRRAWQVEIDPAAPLAPPATRAGD